MIYCPIIFQTDARTGVQVRFCDIDEHSRRIASGLARLGFKRGDFLHYVTYETAQLYLIQVAVWRLGGVVRGSFQNEAPGNKNINKIILIVYKSAMFGTFFAICLFFLTREWSGLVSTYRGETCM